MEIAKLWTRTFDTTLLAASSGAVQGSIDVRILPGVPWEIGLCFTRDQSPVDGTDLMPPGDRQDALDRASKAARQVLRQDDRPMIADQPLQMPLEFPWGLVVVE